MLIFIPTLKRMNKQPTWDAIAPTSYKDKTFLICPVEEAEHHMARGRNVIPCSVNGHTNIGEVRQWMIDRYPTEDILMLDDDLVFAKFKDDAPKLERIEKTPVEMVKMLDKVQQMFDDGYNCVGIQFRSGANRNWPAEYKDNTRIHTAMGFKTSTLHKHNIRFNESGIALMEDMHVVISLLKLGYPNRTLAGYTYDQPASNAPGGCSEYRTLDKMYEVSHKMQELHAPFVKAVRKQTTGRWTGLGNDRWDITVQWKKAYEWGCANANNSR